ncbi:DUF2905 domain-containing protein [Pseudoduganella sp. RAF53_2]|jgi:uncharacterized protein HemY|uniref:DUF2905 domain-containing protein n=1 Tax=unclassified Pseudoduganella TaxID=2637179 RepID=UPI003F9C48B3
MRRLLIIFGLALLLAGVVWPWLRKLPFGRLPGDIHIVKGGFSLHIPIVSCALVSLAVWLILWLFRR